MHRTRIWNRCYGVLRITESRHRCSPVQTLRLRLWFLWLLVYLYRAVEIKLLGLQTLLVLLVRHGIGVIHALRLITLLF